MINTWQKFITELNINLQHKKKSYTKILNARDLELLKIMLSNGIILNFEKISSNKILIYPNVSCRQKIECISRINNIYYIKKKKFIKLLKMQKAVYIYMSNKGLQATTNLLNISGGIVIARILN